MAAVIKVLLSHVDGDVLQPHAVIQHFKKSLEHFIKCPAHAVIGLHCVQKY